MTQYHPSAALTDTAARPEGDTCIQHERIPDLRPR
jgi:hypothetical protein